MSDDVTFTDPSDFHAMMDAEKRQMEDAERTKTQALADEQGSFRDRTWATWKNPVDRKNSQLAKNRALNAWRRAHHNSRA